MKTLSEIQNKMILEHNTKVVKQSRELYLKKVSDLLDKFNCSHINELEEDQKIEFISEMIKNK